MKIVIRNNFRTPIIQITIGDKLSEKFDCLIDTGFTGAFNQIYRVTEIILISVAKPQPIPLILGMSLLKAYKANLSIHFASNKFDLNI